MEQFRKLFALLQYHDWDTAMADVPTRVLQVAYGGKSLE